MTSTFSFRHTAVGQASFGRRSVLAAAGAAAGLALLDGCRKATEVSRQTAGSTTLLIGQVGDILVASPVTRTGNNSSWRGLVLESLAWLDTSSHQLQPALATAWTSAAGGAKISFTVREGATWHTGRPFTGDDVVYTLKALRDAKIYTRPFPKAWLLKMITDLAVDGSVVTITLSAPVAGAMEALAQISMLDKDSASEFNAGTKFVGTGPFRVESYAAGASLALARFDGYWNTGHPELEKVQLKIYDRTDSLLAALKTGQIQMTSSLAPRDAATVDGQNGIEVTTVAGQGQGIYLGASQSSEPLRDVKVRQAIAYAVDRQRIVTDVFKGGATASCAPWLDTAPSYSEQTRDFYTYDPAKAKALVTASDYDGSEIIYEVSGAKPIFANIAQIVQRNLQDVGLNVKLAILQSAETDERFQKTSFRGLYSAGDGNNDTAASFLIKGTRPWSSTNNLWRYTSDRLTSLAAAALHAQDDQVAATGDAYTRYLLDQAVCTELVLIHSQVAAAGVKGFGFHDGQLDLTDATL